MGNPAWAVLMGPVNFKPRSDDRDSAVLMEANLQIKRKYIRRKHNGGDNGGGIGIPAVREADALELVGEIFFAQAHPRQHADSATSVAAVLETVGKFGSRHANFPLLVHKEKKWLVRRKITPPKMTVKPGSPGTSYTQCCNHTPS